MRTIPGMTIVSPADCSEIVKVIHASAEFSGPMYIRLTGAVNNPPVYYDDYHYEIGKGITLKEGKDIAIIACGSMVYESLQAASYLEKGVKASVINMHTIKPLDEKLIKKLLKSNKLIVTVEEHTIVEDLALNF